MTDYEELRDSFYKLAHSQNINMVTTFHNKLFNGINDAIDELEDLENKETDRDKSIRLKASIDIYKNFISNNLRNFTLVMHLSNFEEISTLVCREKKVAVGDGYGIGRFKDCWEKKLAKPVGDIKEWSILNDAFKIRHSILHSHARISFNKKPDVLRNIIKKENLIEKNDRIFVTEEFLNKVLKAVSGMLELSIDEKS